MTWCTTIPGGCSGSTACDDDRAAITALHPRPDFKRRILRAFTDGMAPRPGTTFGTVNADVLERFVPGYQRANLVDIIENSDWPQ